LCAHLGRGRTGAAGIEEDAELGDGRLGSTRVGGSGGLEVEGAGGIRSARRSGARDGVRLPRGRTHGEETARRRSFGLQLRWWRRGSAQGGAAGRETRAQRGGAARARPL
jgi:hypothetical protein